MTAAGWFLSRPLRAGAFFTPDTLPSAPAVLLRHEPFTRVVPEGTVVTRVLYTTRRWDGSATAASALVVVPRAASTGPRPVVAWAHGTLGVVPGCGPSLLPAPFPFDDTVPAVAAMARRGWVMVATDYPGLGAPGPHPYLIGPGEAHAVLDAVRAARHLPNLDLAPTTVLWGHSQGGHAALWSGMLAPTYAPELTIAGVAALAPATDLPALVSAARGSAIGAIMASYLLRAYSEAYTEVRAEAYLRPVARWAYHDMAGRCLAAPGALFSIAEALVIGGDIFGRAPMDGPLGARLAANVPRQAIAAPLLIAQGTEDDLVLPTVQAAYVADRCAAGQAIDYRLYDGVDHVGLVGPDSRLPADLEEWTADRFAGAPAPAECRTRQR